MPERNRCDAASIHLSVRSPRTRSRTRPNQLSNSHIHFAPHAYELADRRDRPRRPRSCLPSSFLPPVRARSFWSVPVERASDGAAVDDPGVRGGGGGGGGCAGHAPGAPRREGPDRRADVLTPAAHGQRDTLRCLPAPRYLLEEGAQADVHLGDLHRRGAHPFREIHVQSTEECHTMCFSMPPLLVHLSCCQVQQGY